ncbi:hypothetical protein D3C84_622230 [compost metagenome]
MRFIDDDKVIVSPVDAVERSAKRLATGASEVGMAQHVIAESVTGKDVGLEITVVVEPVVRQFFGAEHQHRLVAQFVILDDG